MKFADRYQITSLRGRIYDRDMLVNAATRSWLARACGIKRAEVAVVIDSDAFMRGRKGEIPARVVEDAVLEAVARRPS